MMPRFLLRKRERCWWRAWGNGRTQGSDESVSGHQCWLDLIICMVFRQEFFLLAEFSCQRLINCRRAWPKAAPCFFYFLHFFVVHITWASIATHLDFPGSNGRTALHRPICRKRCIFWNHSDYLLHWCSYQSTMVAALLHETQI